MGHDILALPDESQLDMITMQLGQMIQPIDSWNTRFNDINMITKMRRAAYDKYNKVIYRALDAEQFYCGCSGNASTHQFTYAEIKAARQLLPSIVADVPPPIDTAQVEKMKREITSALSDMENDLEHSDVLKKVFPQGVPTIESMEETPLQDTGISEEITFLDAVLAWMEDSNESAVTIYFG